MTVSIWLFSLTKHLFCRNVQLAHLSWERVPWHVELRDSPSASLRSNR
jgi:hypothetical protein